MSPGLNGANNTNNTYEITQQGAGQLGCAQLMLIFFPGAAQVYHIRSYFLPRGVQISMVIFL